MATVLTARDHVNRSIRLLKGLPARTPEWRDEFKLSIQQLEASVSFLKE